MPRFWMALRVLLSEVPGDLGRQDGIELVVDRRSRLLLLASVEGLRIEIEPEGARGTVADAQQDFSAPELVVVERRQMLERSPAS